MKSTHTSVGVEDETSLHEVAMKFWTTSQQVVRTVLSQTHHCGL